MLVKILQILHKLFEIFVVYELLLKKICVVELLVEEHARKIN
jgi:hypothetical protein